MEVIMKKNKKIDKVWGGIFGLLVGDALGVPYEFHEKKSIPPIARIEYIPPLGFSRSYPDVLPGTWSDDGAQALCLLESLLDCKRFCLEDFAEKILDWYENGRWAVDSTVFDVGVQTGKALTELKFGASPYKIGYLYPDGKGNGALMRVLPLALWSLWNEEDKEALIQNAHTQCLVTHGHVCNQVCCALYCLIASELYQGISFSKAYTNALENLQQYYQEFPEHKYELERCISLDEGFGKGYVVDSLRSACMIMRQAESYEEAVKQAVALGNDTDTTACITGGLAGIYFGYKAIPERFIRDLRDKKRVEQLLERMTKHMDY